MDTSSAKPSLPWQQVADALAVGIVILDADGCIQHWNAWMTRQSGFAPSLVLGRTLPEVFGSALGGPFLRALNNALQYDLPVVLSNVLHRHPLPLFRLVGGSLPDADLRTRIPQSVTLMPLLRETAEDGTKTERHCVIQISDTSLFIHREKVLQSRSDQLSKEAVIDGLTGIYNRKFFNQRLPVDLGQALRNDSALSLIMIDVDYFKNYNDNYGHPAGDRVLQSVVKCVQQQLSRPSDLLARYGGEEFIMILSGADQNGAHQLAEKIRTAIVALQLPHAFSSVAQHVTVSLGVTTCPPSCMHDPNDVLESVDQALYAAKRNGRNTTLWLPVRGSALNASPDVLSAVAWQTVPGVQTLPDFSVSGAGSGVPDH